MILDFLSEDVSLAFDLAEITTAVGDRVVEEWLPYLIAVLEASRDKGLAALKGLSSPPGKSDIHAVVLGLVDEGRVTQAQHGLTSVFFVTPS